MPKLAESRFVTGPRDELAVVDVYEVTENAVRNRAESLLDDLAELLGGLRLDFEEFLPLELVENLSDIIESLLNAIQDFLGGLAPNLMEMLSSSTSRLDGTGVLQTLLTDFPIIWNLGAGQVVRVKEGDRVIVEEVDSLVRRRRNELGVTGSDEGTAPEEEGTVHQAAQYLVYSRVTEELIKRELSDALPAVMETLPNDHLKQNVAATVLPVAINTKGIEDPLTRPIDPTRDLVEVNDGGHNVGVIRETSPRFTPKAGAPDPSVIGTYLPSNLPTSSTHNEDPSPAFQDTSDQRYSSSVRDSVGGRQRLMDKRATPKLPGNSSDGTLTTDLQAVEELLTYIPQSTLRHRWPMLVRWLLNGSYPRRGESLEDFHRKVVELTDYVDPDWRSSERDGERVTDLNPYRHANSHVKTAFDIFSDEEERVAAMVANRYRFSNNQRLFEEHYPLYRV